MKIQLRCLAFVGMLLLSGSYQSQQLLNITTTHAGNSRSYRLYIPASYDGNTAVPVLFSFHGGGGTSQDQLNLSDMRPFADTANFILVYPQAFPDPNDGNSNNWIHKEPTSFDDVGFVEALIDEISGIYAVDEERIYVCGYSLGGEFSYELLCRLNDKIAAGVAVARTMGTYTLNQCNPTHPTAVMTILGTSDPISIYTGVVFGGVTYYISSDDVNSYWTDYNNTDPNPIITQVPNTSTSDGSTVEEYRWENGDGCVSFVHYKVNGGGHDWPGAFGNMDISTDLEIWNFVSQYNRSGLIDCPQNGISEASLEPSIELYPNPANEQLEFTLQDMSHEAIRIYDKRGSCLIVLQPQSKTGIIPIASLDPGVYTVCMGSTYKRFVKH